MGKKQALQKQEQAYMDFQGLIYGPRTDGQLFASIIDLKN